MAINYRLSISVLVFVCLCRSFLTLTTNDEDCPAAHPCACSGFTIDCSNLSLTDVPNFQKPTEKTKHYTWQIYLSYNNLKVIPNRAFENLTVYGLSAAHCGLETIEDDALKGSEHTLQSVFLQYNKLTELPAALMKQRKLNMLSVHHNPMTSFNETILRKISETLQWLDIGSEEMIVWPSEFKVLKSIFSLTIYNTPFQLFPDDAFEGLQNSLSMLEFEETKMKQIPRGLKTLKSLSSLMFSDNLYLRDEGFLNDSFSGMLNLTDVAFSNNSLTKVPNLSGLVNLKSLSIANCNISKLDRNSLPTHSVLSSVSLESTSLTKVPKVISSLTNLTSLSLSNNLIETITDDDFAGLTWLQYLTLGNCPIKNVSEDAFRDNILMRGLNLDSTSITTFPKAVKSLINIREVNLYNDSITCTCETMDWIKNWHHSSQYWVVSGECSNTKGRSIDDYIRKDIPNCPN